ncbi:MAG: menaquinone biosynthesis decarboxylase [Bacteroidetes bacterium]|nr:menaquinone biosynthesis decarboxylase [Bacteroidota bacterium]
MAWKSLKHFVDALEKEDELIRVREFVSPHLEIAEITDRISKTPSRNKALLFENTGTPFPLAINLMGSYKRMCLALGVKNLDDTAKELEELFRSFMVPRDNIIDKLRILPELSRLSGMMPKIRAGKGECQEVVMNPPDVTRLPAMKCWPEDGGPFITLPVIHTIDPTSGIRNVGLYRMQVFGPTLTALHWHRHKVSAGHFNQYKKLGKKMPVAVALGGDPVYSYCASAPLPPNMDEYILAGFLRKKAVELVRCLTIDAHVPAAADIIIEGYVDPEEDFIIEGPFGDHTGFYSLEDLYPKFHITCITHRRNAIYPSTIVGVPPQEDAWIGKATERIFLAPIRMTIIPEIVDMNMPVEGVFHNVTIIKIKKEYPGHAQKVMNAMWGAGQMMFNKIMIIVDGGTDIQNYMQVGKAVSENCNPATDIYFSRGPMDVLDHSSSKFSYGGKMCIDATRKFQEENETGRQGDGETGREWENESMVVNLFRQFPGMMSINAVLLKHGISAIIISLLKTKKNQVHEFGANMCSMDEFKNARCIIFIDSEIDTGELSDVVWYAANNIDPERDCFIIKDPEGPSYSHLVIDGTRKTKKFDDFDRPWPNVICSDEATIRQVDDKWNKLGIGNHIPSPSLKYRKLLHGKGAVSEE